MFIAGTPLGVYLCPPQTQMRIGVRDGEAARTGCSYSSTSDLSTCAEGINCTGRDLGDTQVGSDAELSSRRPYLCETESRREYHRLHVGCWLMLLINLTWASFFRWESSSWMVLRPQIEDAALTGRYFICHDHS
jgi:hypothetical protein